MVQYTPEEILSGKTAVACSWSFAWDSFRHAEGIDENFRKYLLYKFVIVNNHVVKESASFCAGLCVSCRFLPCPMCTCVTQSLPHRPFCRTPAPAAQCVFHCGKSARCGSQAQAWTRLDSFERWQLCRPHSPYAYSTDTLLGHSCTCALILSNKQKNVFSIKVSKKSLYTSGIILTAMASMLPVGLVRLRGAWNP